MPEGADWSDKGSITLSEVADLLVPSTDEAFHAPTRQWDGYHQSPLTKAAGTLDQLIEFDDYGTLKDSEGALEALVSWAGPKMSESELKDWLNEGAPLVPAVVAKLVRRLEEMTLHEDQLFARPICRLVRCDQLRYDPHYQAVYQLTPAEMRLLTNTHSIHNQLGDVSRNQKAFWGLSEDLQSAIAMFDSDLGRQIGDDEATELCKDLGLSPGTSITKSLLEIRIDSEHPITPRSLNLFSSLRYWAPPPVFARSVFHMLLWRPVLTGFDLYRRPFPTETGKQRSLFKVKGRNKADQLKKRLKRRLGFYLVAINRFQASNYRLTHYGRLFDLLATVSSSLAGKSRRSSERELRKVRDLHWKELGPSTERFLANLLRPDQAGYDPLGPMAPKVSVHLPLQSCQKAVWERVAAYQENGGPSTVGDLLKLLRDMMIELILWANFQMEIRSVGNIPIQRLYAIELADALEQSILERSDDDSAAEWIRKNAISGDALDKIHLVKIFDRRKGASIVETHKDIIQWLEKKTEN